MNEQRHSILRGAAARYGCGLNHLPDVNLRALPGNCGNSGVNLNVVVKPQEAASVVGNRRERHAQSCKQVAKFHGECSLKQFTSRVARVARFLWSSFVAETKARSIL